MKKTNTTILVFLLFFIGFFQVNINFSLASEVRLENSFVCMMNNKFMGKEQIPVEVGGKIYYGCCEGCKVTLRDDPSARVSLDPYTGKEVDKADAYIVKKPNGSDEVLYFESEKTYENFLKEHTHVGDDAHV